jgi:hypothetical protein
LITATIMSHARQQRPIKSGAEIQPDRQLRQQ